METRHLAIARGEQKVTHIAVRKWWVVSAVCSSTDPDTWVVGAAYVKDGGRASFDKMLKSLDPGIPVSTKVVGISISPDGVVAVALSNDGIHQFVMVDPIDHFAPPKCLPLAPVPHKGNEVLYDFGWINDSSHRHSMVVHSKQETGRERLCVYGHTTNSRANKCDTLVETPAEDIQFFDASPYGHAAFVTPHSNEQRKLTLLSTNERDGVFNKTEIRIDNRRRTPSALAVGNKLVVVGFVNVPVGPSSSYPMGSVDVYDVNLAGGLVCSRALPDAQPTALSTYSTRVLVGASESQLLVWAQGQGSSNPQSKSTLYAFSTKSDESFAICKGGEEHPWWAKDTVAMSDTAWAFAKKVRGAESGEEFSVIEHATCVAI